jgi:spore maturation protein CgeB
MCYQNLYRISKKIVISILFWLLEISRLILIRAGNRRGHDKYPLIFVIDKIFPMLDKANKDAYHMMHFQNKDFFLKRLLVIGELDYGTTSWSRSKELKKMFKNVKCINISPFVENLSLLNHILTNHFYCSNIVRGINQSVLKTADEVAPQILWVDKCLYLWPETLGIMRRKGCYLLVDFSPDNQIMRTNQSRHYLKSIPFYSCHITTKKHNVEWLRKCGAHQVQCINNGFDPELHRTVKLSQGEEAIFKCDIGFVGHWEPSREYALLRLWKQGYNMKVWGGNWNRARHRNHPLFISARHLTGDEYAKAICGAKINLCLLSRWNGDKTTDRSVEIPACGKFMLAERTEEHLLLFKEGKEAEFYDIQEEMLRKIEYYLSHEKEREVIAKAGQMRCLSGYSYENHLKEALSKMIAPISKIGYTN